MSTNDKIYTCVGINFELENIMSERILLEVIKSLYGLPKQKLLAFSPIIRLGVNGV